MPYENTGVYSDIPALSEGAARLVAINQNPFLAEMMKRQDARAWEQYQALEAARHVPAFPKVPGASPQAAYQNQMQDALAQSWGSGNPMALKMAQQGFEPLLKAILGNTEQTQEQKNAFGAAPNDAQMAAELIRRQVDPSFALNVASNNRIKETGYEYGQKRGFENLQLGNKKDFAGFEQGLKGFGTAPLADGTLPTKPTKPLSAETAGKLALVNAAKRDIQAARSLVFDKNGEMNDWLLARASAPMTAGIGGEARMLRSSIENAVASKLRLETGAAANASEVKNIADRFMPTIVDTKESAADKLDRLEQFMTEAGDLMTTGQSSVQTPHSANGSGEAQSPVAFNSAKDFADYAKKQGWTPEQLKQEYQKYIGGQ